MPGRSCVTWLPNPQEPGVKDPNADPGRGCISDSNPAHQELTALLRDAFTADKRCALESIIRLIPIGLMKSPRPDASASDRLSRKGKGSLMPAKKRCVVRLIEAREDLRSGAPLVG
jgi:hypothetical protein